jgi:thiopurine S-methyltransferase
MTPEFWLDRWQRGDIGWHLTEINLHLQAFWPRLGLAPETLVFVPLCGKTLDLLWLMSRGHRVLGVEISEQAVKELFAEHGLVPRVTDAPPFRLYQVDELRILAGDYFALTPRHLEGVGAVFDRASLIALPPEMRPEYAAHFKTIVPHSAASLLITLDYDQTEMTGPPFAVGRDEVERLLADRYEIQALADFDIIEESPGFRRRGLTALSEQVWHLAPRGTSHRT